MIHRRVEFWWIGKSFSKIAVCVTEFCSACRAHAGWLGKRRRKIHEELLAEVPANAGPRYWRTANAPRSPAEPRAGNRLIHRSESVPNSVSRRIFSTAFPRVLVLR